MRQAESAYVQIDVSEAQLQGQSDHLGEEEKKDPSDKNLSTIED